MKKTGIVGYGIYIPKQRIKVEEIANVWGKNGSEISKSLGIKEKSVPNIDEDTVTLGYEAAINALSCANISPQKIESCLVGSESHPYAVNPTATIIGEFLGIGNNYLAADLEFACKAATAAMQALCGLVESDSIEYGLAIGSDTAQSKPHDVLEYTAAAGAGAYIIGKEKVIAKILEYTSFSSDTPDFWRREGIRYPSHSGRFTGEPAYFVHVMGAARRLLEKTKKTPKDFDYCVFHMPNGKFPRQVAKRLGFTEEQLLPSLIVDHIGNPYSAASLIGLAAVLDIAKPNKKILCVSYGSGAGADSFILETTEELLKKRKKSGSFAQNIKNTKYLTYTQYLRMEKKI